jgi:hypothetical protein
VKFSGEGDDNELFWDLAGELMAENERVTEGSIMNSRCIRVSSAAPVKAAKPDFLAMPHHKKSGLVVKLPADRVAELIEAGVGEPFAPAGKVFREWLAVTEADEDAWRSLLREGVAFVGD